ncbi:MAG: hypothetical protein LBF40_00840 [Deltaproteobacteria bacterium]|jgi:hypothetical protein|nr:hypothetical protein [Deltaproteobacteria bacterium]
MPISNFINIGGLSIKGKSLYSTSSVGVKSAIGNSVLKIANGYIGTKVSATATQEAKTNYLSLSFRDSLLRNLNVANQLIADNKKKSEEQKEKLVDSVVAAAEEIRKSFGYAEANRFMAMVLTTTESDVTEARLASAMTEFLTVVKDKALSTLASAGVTEEVSAEADKTLGKLQDFVVYLNNGSEDSKTGLSVASAMNEYFGRGQAADEDKRIFTDGLEWLSANEVAAAEAASNASFVITKAELATEALEETVTFLTEQVASEKAAAVIVSLKEDEDIFDAVDEVRTILAEEDDEEAKEAGTNAQTDASTAVAASATEALSATNAAAAAAAAAAVAVSSGAADDGKIAESDAGATISGSNAAKVLDAAVKAATKSALFDMFLENYFLAEINKTIQNDKNVGGRLTTVVSSKIGVGFEIGSVGISTWPGLFASRGTGLSVSVGFEREFSISVGKDNKVETKFTQSVKIEATFRSAPTYGIGSGGALVAAGLLTLANSLETRYLAGRIATNNTTTPSAIRSSYLLSSLV